MQEYVFHHKSNKLWQVFQIKHFVCIDFENGLLYCYFALSAMEKYLVESLNIGCIGTHAHCHQVTSLLTNFMLK